jgi:hypothetical protein
MKGTASSLCLMPARPRRQRGDPYPLSPMLEGAAPPVDLDHAWTKSTPGRRRRPNTTPSRLNRNAATSSPAHRAAPPLPPLRPKATPPTRKNDANTPPPPNPRDLSFHPGGRECEGRKIYLNVASKKGNGTPRRRRCDHHHWSRVSPGQSPHPHHHQGSSIGETAGIEQHRGRKNRRDEPPS